MTKAIEVGYGDWYIDFKFLNKIKFLLETLFNTTLSEEEIEDVIICLNDLGYIEVVDNLKEQYYNT